MLTSDAVLWQIEVGLDAHTVCAQTGMSVVVGVVLWERSVGWAHRGLARKGRFA